MSYLTLEVYDDTSDEGIKELANSLLESGGYQDNLEYSHTMDMDMWDITEEVCDCDEQMKEHEATSSNV